MIIEYKHNTASEKEILDHLVNVAPYFVEDLTKRVDVEAYAKKLFSKAKLEEAWVENDLIGLVAYYINESTCESFITNVSVSKEYIHQGIATQLLQSAKEYSIKKGMRKICLQVVNDDKLIKFYSNAGYTQNNYKSAPNEYYMEMLLNSGEE